MAHNNLNSQFERLMKGFRKELRDSVNDIRLDALYQKLLLDEVFGRPEPLAAMSGWSISPEFGWWLYRYVKDHRPAKVVELGSGTSTLIIAHALKSLGGGARLISFDNDYEYAAKTRSLLQLCELEEFAEVVYAPLETYEIGEKTYCWYSIPFDLLAGFSDSGGIDLLLIDGPPKATNSHARYPAYPLLRSYFNDNTLIILDDAGRVEEREILERWMLEAPGGSYIEWLPDIRHSPALFKLGGASSVEGEKRGEGQNKIIFDELSRVVAAGEKEGDELTHSLVQAFYRYRESGAQVQKRKIEFLESQNLAINCALEKQKKIAMRARDELDRSIQEIARLTSDNKKIKRERSLFLEEINKIKGSLRYKVAGVLARHVGSFLGMVKLPLALWRVISRHKKNKTARLQHKAQRNIGLIGCVKSKPALSLAQQANEKNIFWVASQLVIYIGQEKAVAFAESICAPRRAASLNLLRASFCEGDEDWLRNVNIYLAQYALSPISLRAGDEPRFLRLGCDIEKMENSDVLVSVIMPAYNSERTIRHSAFSILSQTWRNIQLIIVDDASTDSTWDLCQEIERADSRVTILRNAANVGPYVSKNIALQYCKGEYITGQDADDWSHPQRLERHIKYMREQGLMAGFSGMVRLTIDGSFEAYKTGDGFRRGASISAIYNASFLRDKLGYWDTARFGADSEMIARAQKILGPLYGDYPAVGMLCLVSENGLTSHPEHGVSREMGISPSRKFYRGEWCRWHDETPAEDLYLPFPHDKDRKFDVSDAAKVSADNLSAVLSMHA